MQDERAERLKALAGRLDGEGHREDAHDIRNLLAHCQALQMIRAALNAEVAGERDQNARLRRELRTLLVVPAESARPVQP